MFLSHSHPSVYGVEYILLEAKERYIGKRNERNTAQLGNRGKKKEVR